MDALVRRDVLRYIRVCIPEAVSTYQGNHPPYTSDRHPLVLTGVGNCNLSRAGFPTPHPEDYITGEYTKYVLSGHTSFMHFMYIDLIGCNLP